MELNVLTLRHPLTLAKMALKKLLRIGRSAGPKLRRPEQNGPQIDPFQLISSRSLEELNKSADEYFSSLSDWDHHLAKPFSTIHDAPGLLINFATMLQGLDLIPGHRLLEFGAGTGWASRYLTQLGCEVVLLDVSPTALKIAEELYRRQPVFGNRPKPRYLPFDGSHIPLPDASIDRILCFDAFHHAPDPQVILREFSRVLVDGGIAAFAEPGPRHSRTPQSQFEMRTYGVIENDVDIREIWRAAQQTGFEDIKLAAFNIPPFQVALEQYEDLLQGGETFLRWAEVTRRFLDDARNFFLKKPGREREDSRRMAGLSANVVAEVKRRVGASVEIGATVTNNGSAVWLPSTALSGGVSLGCHLFDSGSKLINFNFHWQQLTEPPREIFPGQVLSVVFLIPALTPGAYELELDCVSNGVSWFAQLGSRPARVSITIEPPSDPLPESTGSFRPNAPAINSQ